MARQMVVVPYDEKWPVLYEKEKLTLQAILGDLILEIHHFGSTSMPGICAKPIIDVMVVVEAIEEVDKYNSQMEQGGYSVRGENGIPGRRYFVRLHPDGSGNHTHHIHVYHRGNPHIADELLFRDYLRINEGAMREYERVKLEASEKHLHSPLAYVEAKYECVMKLTKEAQAFFAGR